MTQKCYEHGCAGSPVQSQLKNTTVYCPMKGRLTHTWALFLSTWLHFFTHLNVQVVPSLYLILSLAPDGPLSFKMWLKLSDGLSIPTELRCWSDQLHSPVKRYEAWWELLSSLCLLTQFLENAWRPFIGELEMNCKRPKGSLSILTLIQCSHGFIFAFLNFRY